MLESRRCNRYSVWGIFKRNRWRNNVSGKKLGSVKWKIGRLEYSAEIDENLEYLLPSKKEKIAYGNGEINQCIVGTTVQVMW